MFIKCVSGEFSVRMIDYKGLVAKDPQPLASLCLYLQSEPEIVEGLQAKEVTTHAFRLKEGDLIYVPFGIVLVMNACPVGFSE